MTQIANTPTGSFTQSSSQKKRKSSFSNKNKKDAKAKQLSPKVANPPVIGLDQMLSSGFISQVQNY